MFILTPAFTEADIYVLENTDPKALTAAIEFLKTHQEIMWLDNDTGEIVCHSELTKRKLKIQPHPQYPEELIAMGEIFCNMLSSRQDLRVDLSREGFFEKNTLAALPIETMYSATFIATCFCFSFVHERLHDGYFSYGVEDGSHLKMLLRLEDLMKYYEYTKALSASIRL